MARLRIKSQGSFRALGELIYELSGREDDYLANRASFNSQIAALVDANPPRIELVFDTADVVHIVVPYFYNEKAEKEPLSSVGAEAAGDISIRGCGK